MLFAFTQWRAAHRNEMTDEWHRSDDDASISSNIAGERGKPKRLKHRRDIAARMMIKTKMAALAKYGADLPDA